MNKQQFLAMSSITDLKGFVDGRSTISGETIYTLHSVPNKCKTVQIASTMDEDEFYVEIYKFKPVCYPLSDLTKQIEHNGETFVPIVELAKFANVEAIGRVEFSEQTEYQTHFYVDYINRRVRKRFQLRRLTFEKEGVKLDFGYFYPYKPGFLHVDNQFGLFTKLIEWHFDIASLIEQGDAIDVNTLDANPYK